MLKLLKNKYLLTAGAVLVFGLTIAIGILYAKDRVALNDILNEEEAINFAYLDAGVSSDDVISYTAKRDKALGEYVYRINFSSKDTTYSYVVDANHGDIISGIKENTGNGNIAQNNNSDNNNNPSLSIHEEKPENTEKKPDENSQKDVNKDKTDDKPKTDDKSGGTGNTGGDAADKPSATKTDDTTKNTPSKKPDKTESNTNTSSDTKRYISVDKAKTIALKQAGLTPAMVTFGKAVLKKDDDD
nr:PepSY domain-containing protein [uncultured Catonella sp.]